MGKILCFEIGWNNLYLEQSLIDFGEIPLFFICKDQRGSYYLVLCVDFEEYAYWVIPTLQSDLLDLLNGRLAMRDSITKQGYLWEVHTGQDIESDKVTLRSMESVDSSLLPKEGVFYKILNEDVKSFIERLEREQR